MTTPSQPSKEEIARAIYGFAADMMKQGKSHYEIEKALTDKGLDPTSSRNVINSLSNLGNNAVRQAALKNMAIGGVICLIGIIVTVGSYSAASSSSGGGRYVITWGAVIFGGLQFIRGLMAYRQG